MKRIIGFFAVLVLLASLFSSCQTRPQTKQEYLEAYNTFISEIRENKSQYSEQEWEKQDAKFTLYSEELYEEFGKDLGLLEQAKVAKYAIVYGAARGTSSLNSAIKNVKVDKVFDEVKSLWQDDLKQDFNSTLNELEGTWTRELKQKLGSELDGLKATLEDEKTVEGIKDRIDRIQEIINDEEIRGKSEDVLKEMEEILKKIERKANKR